MIAMSSRQNFTKPQYARGYANGLIACRAAFNARESGALSEALLSLFGDWRAAKSTAAKNHVEGRMVGFLTHLEEIIREVRESGVRIDLPYVNPDTYAADLERSAQMGTAERERPAAGRPRLLEPVPPRHPFGFMPSKD
jgi:hypothetical protein